MGYNVSTCSTPSIAVPSCGEPPPEKMPETPAPQFGQNLVSDATVALHLGQALVVAVVICCDAAGELLGDATQSCRRVVVRPEDEIRVEGERPGIEARRCGGQGYRR